jgi:hypothetical protein
VEGRLWFVHRYVMELALARPLRHEEVVHHRDGNRHNNALDNLALLSHAAHNNLHNRKHPAELVCAWCGSPFVNRNCRPPTPTRCCSNRCRLSLGGLVLTAWCRARAGQASRPLGATSSCAPPNSNN